MAPGGELGSRHDDRRFVRPLLVAEALFVLVANGVWLTVARARYGW